MQREAFKTIAHRILGKHCKKNDYATNAAIIDEIWNAVGPSFARLGQEANELDRIIDEKCAEIEALKKANEYFMVTLRVLC